MKLNKLTQIIAGAVLVSSMAVSANTTTTRIGDIDYQNGYPTVETMDQVLNEMDFQRATQLYMWGVPLTGIMEWVNTNRNEFNLEEGQLSYYFTRAQKQGIITSNFTTPYICGAWNVSETGPLVLELPEARMAGMLMDVHQRIQTDLSLLGPDKGKGGKYLILPPGHKEVDAPGYHVIYSKSSVVFVGLRILDPNIDTAAKEIVPNVKTYTWEDGKEGKVLPVVATPEVEWSNIPKDGLEYWQTIHQWLQEEAIIEERDRFMVAYLKGLGIEKGKPFSPTAEQKTLLIEASEAGRIMSQSNDYMKRFAEPYWEGTNWKDAIAPETNQRTEHYDQIDERNAWFWEAVTISRGMKSTIPGFGQRYMVTYTDADDGFLTGEHTYKLNVPADVPATNFWAVTLYSEKDRLMIENDAGSPEVSSRKQNLKVNADGSTDLYFGPKPVEGFENNWIQTNPGKGWFPYFRFYGPTEQMFDKTWTMGDIELVK
ncbi:DUF1254 domain-containing protein [uncultured Vibrio sp.]|uniref:DUF1254 domain-containing protein n=1 Tax=uncultured Vibrio sp. TaxID=114054 RepID=UPI0025F4FCC0|nr:DUF1254 domain-containing protein [uncultured Vibrio sp.]